MTPWEIESGHDPDCECEDCLRQDALDAEGDYRHEALRDAQERLPDSL